ncbi:TonB-dependent receptor family protein [Flavobacteriaceae bacterium F08102]|nr:TonB-dependent receptor family protein [Flavobacteriaceae bacterium F08102]
MKNFILYFLTILTFFAANAQAPSAKIQIKGKVLDKETKEPLEYATIVLTPINGGAVTGGLTDSAGNFKIEVDKGVYNISIEYLSFKSYKLQNKQLDTDFDMGTISLEIDSETLDEIELIAEKTTVEIKLDKKIYNVGKDLTVRGGTVSDVLDNVPSVSVDVEGNVALRGNDNVRILINGKPSGLVGLNSSEALRQLPADAIEKVEVITSPSARYDAEGTAGILNIILRRSKLQGLNGSVTVNTGIPTAAGISGNINYRVGDFNFFTTSGYSYKNSPGKSFTDKEFFGIAPTPSTFLREDKETKRIRKGLNTNFGIEWYLNESTSITGSVFYKDSNNENNTTTNSKFTNTDGQINLSQRFDPELEDDKTIQYSLNIDKKFKKEGHSLVADFQYENSNEDENSLINEGGLDIERVNTDENQERILAQTDYVLPLGENSQFEAGYKGNFNTLDTDYAVEFRNETTNEFELDENISNRLIYKEYVNAFYTQYGAKINKLSILLGLRLENTKVTINQVTTNDKNVKNYNELFPTINLGYEINEKQSITLGYNRRLRRPRSYFINPFPSRSSTTTIFQGNPNLDPTFSNAVDFGYLNRLGKITLNTSIYYQHSTNVISFVEEPTGVMAQLPNGDEVPEIRRFPLNLDSSDRYGFEFTLTYNPTRSWKMDGNFNFFESNTKGENSLGENLDNKNTSWSAKFNNKLTLPGQIEWQTKLSYRGPQEDAQNKRKGIFSTDLAFSKDLFNEKASLALSVNDLFNSNKRASEIFAPTFRGTSEFRWRQRSINLSFTYRFNQKKKQQQRPKFDMDDGEDFGG